MRHSAVLISFGLIAAFRVQFSLQATVSTLYGLPCSHNEQCNSRDGTIICNRDEQICRCRDPSSMIYDEKEVSCFSRLGAICYTRQLSNGNVRNCFNGAQCVPITAYSFIGICREQNLFEIVDVDDDMGEDQHEEEALQRKVELKEHAEEDEFIELDSSTDDESDSTTPDDGNDTVETSPGDGDDDTTPTTPDDGSDTVETSPGDGNDTTPTTPGGGGETAPTTPGGGGETIPTTPGDGGETMPTTPGGEGETTQTTPGGGGETTQTTTGGGNETVPTTTGDGGETAPTTPEDVRVTSSPQVTSTEPALSTTRTGSLIGEVCYGPEDCIPRFSKCEQSFCWCNSGYTPELGGSKCSRMVDYSCGQVSGDCIANASCTYTGSPLCKCNDKFVMKNQNTQCGLIVNEPCQSKDECLENADCKSDGLKPDLKCICRQGFPPTQNFTKCTGNSLISNVAFPMILSFIILATR